MMGKLDHETSGSHGAAAPGAPLFDSLKQVWLTSLTRPDVLHGRNDPPGFQTAGADRLPDFVIVSQPPPARVLP
ncbi:MAG: hypothetical protein L6R19_07925 [Alphaproteobacteria bacterium]|nr:hypothetical protein [Alphaproteobacteria bacterium]